MWFGFGKGLILRVAEQRMSGAEERYEEFSLKNVAKGITIGRLESSTIVVPTGYATQAFVSREHGRIVYDKDRLWYEDISSKGTILDRGGHQWPVHRQLIELREGDTLLIGFRDGAEVLAGMRVTVHRFKK